MIFNEFSEFRVYPGTFLYSSPLKNIIFGCPSEILKVLLKQHYCLPSVLVLPDTLYKHNTCQISIEFIIYHFLFVQKGLARGKKLEIFGDTQLLHNLKEFIRVTLFGINLEELENVEQKLQLEPKLDKELLTEVLRENTYFSIKNKDGEVLKVEDFVEFIPFEIGQTVYIKQELINGFPIKMIHKAFDRFEIQCKSHIYTPNIEISRPQIPCYEIKHEPIPASELDNKNVFSLRVFGNSEGFDPQQPANGYLIRIRSHWILWDCPPYTNIHLKNLGLGFEDLFAIFISHVHEDHLDIAQLLHHQTKCTIYTSPEIFHCFLIKAMTVLACNYDTAREFFNFVPIYANEPFEILKSQFEVFYSVHVIPTLGLKLKVLNDKTNTHTSFFLSGDHVMNSKVEELKEDGLLQGRRGELVDKIVPQPLYDVNFIDAGKGIIHGSEKEYADMKVKNGQLYFMHTKKIQELPENQLQLKHGQVITLHQ